MLLPTYDCLHTHIQVLHSTRLMFSQYHSYLACIQNILYTYYIMNIIRLGITLYGYEL